MQLQTSSPAPLRRMALVAVATLVAIMSCGREPTAPGGQAVRYMRGFSFVAEFPPVFQTSGAGSLVPFTRVRITLFRANNQPAKDTVITFPAGVESVTLTLDVPLSGDAPESGEPLTLNLRYVNAQGDTVFRGSSPVTAKETAPGAGPPPPVTITVQYTGPGASATSVRISPRTQTVNAGAGFTFTAVALDGGGNVVANAPIGWSSLDPQANITNQNSGSGTAVLRGSARIRAAIANNAADTVNMLIVAVPSAVEIVSGSGQSALVGTALPLPIVARVRASDGGAMNNVPVTFTAANGGSVGAATVTSDLTGLASTTWRLGPNAGAQTVTARVAGLTAVGTFTATATAKPATKLVFGGTVASAQAGVPFTVTVQAQDEDSKLATAFTGPVTLSLSGGATGAVLSGGAAVNAVAGVATFTQTAVNLVGEGYRLTAAGGTLATSTSNTFDVTPSAANKMIFSTQPPPIVNAGETIRPIVVTVQDRSGNTVTGFTGAVTMSIKDNPTATDTLAGAKTVNAIAGLATFNTLKLHRPARGYTLLATSANGGEVKSDPFEVIVGFAASCSIARGNNQTKPALSALDTITIVVVDSAGNPVPKVVVRGSVTTGTGTLKADSAVTDSSGRANLFWTLGSTVGPQTLRVTCAGVAASALTVTATATTLAPPQVIKLKFGVQPSNGTAGIKIAPAFTIQASDTLGAPVTGTYLVNLTLLNAAGAVISGQAFTATASTGLATFANTIIRKSGVGYKLIAAGPGTRPDTSAAFNIVNAPPVQLLADSGMTQTAAVATALANAYVVRVVDSLGNAVQGIEVFWAAVGGGSVSSTYTVTDANGRARSTRTLGNTTGAQTATASSTGSVPSAALRTGDAAVHTDLIGSPLTFTSTATPGPASQLAITTQPSGAVTAVNFTQQPVIEVRDSFGNRTTGTTAVTAAIASGPGTLSGTTTVNAVAGVATFTSLRITGLGAHTLTFTATAVTSATSASFTVLAAPPTQLVITTQPAGAVSGSTLVTQPVVQLRDANNLLVVGATNNVTVALASGTGALLGTTTVAAVNGVATFANLQINGAGAHTLTFTAATLTSASSSSFTVTQVATTLVIMSQPPATATTNVAFTSQPVLQVRDAANLLIANATTPVTATIASGPGTLAGTTTVNAIGGVVAFSGLRIIGLGAHTLSFTAGALPVVTSVSINVLPAPPTQLGITTQPAGAVSGSTLTTQPVVEVRDATGLAVVGSTNSVAVAIASGTGTLTGTTTVAAVNGVATFTNLKINGAGAHTLTFTSSGLTSSTSASFTVTQVATALVIATQPSASAVTNTNFSGQPVVQIRDAGNVLIASSTASVSVAIASGPGTLSGTTTVSAAGGVATFTNLRIVGLGAHTLTFTSSGLTSATSNSISVVNSIPTQLTITTQPSGAVSGSALTTQPVVEVRDNTNAAVTGSTNNVTAAIASGTGTLSGTTTVAAVNGVATFMNLQINGAGAHTLTFTSSGLTSATSASFTLTQVATALVIATQPSASATTNVNFAVQPVVHVRDAGNVSVVGNTASVTAAIASGSGTLSGTTTVAAVNGVATFTNLRIVGSGAHTLTFTSGGLTSATSNSISVTLAPPTQLGIATQPAGAVSGSPFTTQPVIEVRDGTGLLVAGATNSVTAAIASGSGTLVGTTAVTAVNGVATFTNLQINGGGAHTLVFTSSGLTSVTSASFTVTQVAASLAIGTQPSANAVNSVAFPVQPVIQVRDPVNVLHQTATNSVTVSLNVLTGTGSLGGTTTVSALNGVANFSGLSIAGTGTFTLSFVSGTLTSVTSGVITVTNTLPTQLAITTQPAGATSGSMFTTQPVIALRDASNLLTASATNSVTATITSGSGMLSGTTTVAAVAGVVTFTNLRIDGCGNHTLTFTSSGLTSAVSASFNVACIRVNIGAAATATVGNTQTITIPISFDMSNRPAGGPAGTLTATDVASISYTLTWDPTKFTFSGTSAAAPAAGAAGFTTIPNTGTQASGTISVAAFAPIGTTSSLVLYNLVLTATATGTTPVVGGALTAGNEAGGTLTAMVLRNLSVTITP